LSKASAADYSQRVTERCERVLVTILVDQDGPAAYAAFTAATGADPDQMRQEAVAVARQFLQGVASGSERAGS
jgi:hypothetical protein